MTDDESAVRHAKAEGRPQWQSMESAPKHRNVLLYADWHSPEIWVGRWWDAGVRTLWMPLPDPPEVSGSDRPDSERP
jgi:hypothetical protein